MNTTIPLLLALPAAFAWACASLAQTPDGADWEREFTDLPANPNLPDPLLNRSGKPVSSRNEWTRSRRGELIHLFQRFMYGQMPPPLPVHAHVNLEDRAFMGGKATLKLVSLEVGEPPVRTIQLLEILPNHRSQPAPVFLGLAFCPVAAVVDDPRIPIPSGWMYEGVGVVQHRATEAVRGTAQEVWNPQMVVDRGYGLVVFYNGDIEPDVNGTRDGIRAHIASAPAPHNWGTIAAWAWGAQRVVDYLIRDADVDARRIAIVGHSRNGKAALLAAALDERIALAIPVQAGCGGTAPSRGKIGETVRQINTAFPHWFCDAFKAFNDQPEKLPMDQHELVALMAPRPVLFTNASEDQWANPAGQFTVLKAADPVYRFLGVEGLGSSTMPEEGHLLKSRLGYFIRPGKHSMTAVDWTAILDYADRWLRKQPTGTR
ncbi:MAG: acetylxylan esterase [Chthonomonadales bacterium]